MLALVAFIAPASPLKTAVSTPQQDTLATAYARHCRNPGITRRTLNDWVKPQLQPMSGGWH